MEREFLLPGDEDAVGSQRRSALIREPPVGQSLGKAQAPAETGVYSEDKEDHEHILIPLPQTT